MRERIGAERLMDNVGEGILREPDTPGPDREIGSQLKLASTNFEPIQVFPR